MLVSVVMTTYNGSKYIIEQLDSILKQTRKADEVIILDDASNDNTVEIIEEFIKKSNLINWYVIKNVKNVGWRRNFINGFHQAKGDIVFCADQDDIWYPEKIEVMSDIMEKNDKISVLASNLEVFWEKDSKRNNYQCIQYGVKELEKVNFDKMWLEPWRPGCAMAFKRSLLPLIDKVWFEECAHDLLLWAIGIVRGEAYIINRVLIHYRRHSNVSTPSNAKNKSTRIGLMRLYDTLSEQIISNKDIFQLSHDMVEKISAMKNFYRQRESAIKKKDLYELLCLLFSLNLYPKKKSWIADVISSYRE